MTLETCVTNNLHKRVEVGLEKLYHLKNMPHSSLLVANCCHNMNKLIFFSGRVSKKFRQNLRLISLGEWENVDGPKMLKSLLFVVGRDFAR